MASTTAEFHQPPPAAGTSTGPGLNLPPLSYESLNRLADEKFWPAVNAFTERYKENPSQTLLLTTLSLLAFVPLSAFVALLFLVATLSACALLLVLQVTLVCSSVVIAGALSVLALSTLTAPGLVRVTEELKNARSYLFSSSPSQPAPSAESAEPTPPQFGFRQPGSRRGFIRRNVAKPRVILGLAASMVVATPIVFLLRHVIVSLLEILLFLVLRLVLRAVDNIFTLTAVVGYIGYRIGRPSRRSASSPPTTSAPIPSVTEPAPATEPVREASPPSPIEFTLFTQYRASVISFIASTLKIAVTGILRALRHYDEGLMWVLNKINEGDVQTSGGDSSTGMPVDVKKGQMKATGEEDEGYEMLPTASGSSGIASSSALDTEGKGGLAERRGKKVAFEDES